MAFPSLAGSVGQAQLCSRSLDLGWGRILSEGPLSIYHNEQSSTFMVSEYREEKWD